MKSFFNHWRLSISPGSVGKINSHQQRGSGWLWRAHCGGSVEGNHFLDQQIQKLKESLGLFTYIWMVNFYANSIHEYIYIYMFGNMPGFFFQVEVETLGDGWRKFCLLNFSCFPIWLVQMFPMGGSNVNAVHRINVWRSLHFGLMMILLNQVVLYNSLILRPFKWSVSYQLDGGFCSASYFSLPEGT